MNSPEASDYRQPYLAEELSFNLQSRKKNILSAAATVILQMDAVHDKTDRELLKEAVGFIRNPTESLADNVKHTTNVGQVLAGYMRQGAEEPPAIDAMHAYLLALQCINRINFVEKEIENGSSYSPAIQKSMLLTFDTATILSRGYNDFTMLRGLLDLHRKVARLE